MSSIFTHINRNYAIIIISLILIITHIKLINYDLIFLDDDTIVYSQYEKSTFSEEIISIFTTNFLGGHYYRPLTSFSFYVNSVFSRNSPIFYHITNFLLHLLSSILIYLVLQKLGYTKVTSFISALIFTVNPIHINAVGWIAGRGDLLAAFLTLIAFFIYIKFINSNRIRLLLLVLIFIFLSFLSKEVALLTPFLFLIFYFIEKKELQLNKNGAGVLLMILITLGLYYILRVTISSNVHIDKFSFTTYYKNILVLPETISKFFIPTGIKALPSIEVFTSISGIVIFILLLLIPFKYNSINRYRYYFGLIWFIILLIPGMVFRTMEQDGFYYWDCRSYLPSVGLIFMSSEIIRIIDLKNCKKIYFSVIVIYLLILSAFSSVKIEMYENPIKYWNSVKADYPKRFLPYVGLYNYYSHIGDEHNSEKQLLRAIKISPKELSVIELLINYYLKQSESEKAFELLKNTIIIKKIYTNSLIEKYISLSVKLNRKEEIDNLLISYKNDNKALEVIDKIKSQLNL